MTITYPANICWSSRRLDVLKTSLENVLKTCFQDIFRTSSTQKKWGYLDLKNLNGYMSSDSIFHKSIHDKSKANPNLSIRTQSFQYLSYFEIQAAFYFEN